MSALVRDSKKKPEKLREVKEREKQQATQRAAIQTAVGGLQREEQVISSSKIVQSAVKEQADVELSLKQIRLALRKDCRLGFVRAKKFQPRANSDRCLVQRQQYALEMLKLLDQGKRIINLDETWLNETSFIRRTWAPKDGTGNVKLKPVTPRLSMIAALDTDGRVWFALGHANTDSNVMALFLSHLL